MFQALLTFTEHPLSVCLAQALFAELRTVDHEIGARLDFCGLRSVPTYPRHFVHSQRMSALADQKSLALAAELEIYFCDPHSPWQRGTNENTNRFLREYFPKDTDLSAHTQEPLDAVARKLNERPRLTLNYVSPAEKFEECVASIG